MSRKILDVRKVGFRSNMPGDTRSPESFAFPACLTSLMEYLGEDVRWETIRAHNREWTQRFVNKEYLAASGMSFGLLWHSDQCLSSLDLMQVNGDHHDAIRHAFDWAGYGYESIENTQTNDQVLFDRVVGSIDAGKPVLAFGIIDPPECAIVCGYDTDRGALIGWSHFQSYDPADCAENGMFQLENRRDGWWEVVLCGEKKAPVRDLEGVIRQGLHIMNAMEVDGYLAGFAAYDAWTAYVADPGFAELSDEELKGKYRFHHMLVGNHAEARCYLGNFLSAWANGNESLIEAAECFNAIHDTCWKVWGAAGGINAPEGYKAFYDAAKRDEIAGLLADIKTLDKKAMAAMEQWLTSREERGHE